MVQRDFGRINHNRPGSFFIPMKTLWLNIIKSIGGLKTPEQRLLFGVLVMMILVLGISFRDNSTERILRIHALEKDKVELQRSKETQRILMQDKLDQCKDEKLLNLEKMLDVSEKFKKLSKKLK